MAGESLAGESLAGENLTKDAVVSRDVGTIFGPPGYWDFYVSGGPAMILSHAGIDFKKKKEKINGG